MKRRVICIEVNDDGSVFSTVPSREWTDEERQRAEEEGGWEPWQEHPSLGDALDRVWSSVTVVASEAGDD